VSVNKERVQLLVDALRSGKYEQGRLLLWDDQNDRYCCLGVATRIAIEHGVVPDDRYVWSHTGLHDEVRKWYGFISGNPPFQGLFNDEGKRLDAIGANDHARLTFPEIADAFEETYLKEGS
jgi:hypothetical protein